MFKTTLVVILIAIIASFAGCQPLASYKDRAIDYIGSLIEPVNNQSTTIETTNVTKPITETPAIASTPTKEATKIEQPNLDNISEQELKNNPELQKIIDDKKAEEAKRIADRIAQEEQRLLSLGQQVVTIVNNIRAGRGIGLLQWDDKLYKYSKAHSIAMAEKGDLFHSPMGLEYAENCWGGSGSHWGAEDIVNSWMNSPKHRTWLLCPHLKHVAVGIADSGNGMYASWTFWTYETLQADWWYQYTPDNPPDWWY